MAICIYLKNIVHSVIHIILFVIGVEQLQIFFLSRLLCDESQVEVD